MLDDDTYDGIVQIEPAMSYGERSAEDGPGVFNL
jgi:hypothetical protein